MNKKTTPKKTTKKPISKKVVKPVEKKAETSVKVEAKPTPKKVVQKKKKPVRKVVSDGDPLNCKQAINELRRHYAALDKLNVQRTIVLQSIAKKEAALAEVIDLNMAQLESASGAPVPKKEIASLSSRSITDLRPAAIAAPLKDTDVALASLNAIARRY